MIPQDIIDRLSPTVRSLFLKWDDFMHTRVIFNRPQSMIHAYNHCERVLLHALIIGESEFGDDPAALVPLAHAAVFHDTRRQDDYLDTGHGARAAVYYRDFCKDNPDIDYKPEAALMMKYHDINDTHSKKAIEVEYAGNLSTMLKYYDIFKDADALDRWRLGPRGLDPTYLRTPQAKKMSDFARHLVEVTEDEDLLNAIAAEVEAKWVDK